MDFSTDRKEHAQTCLPTCSMYTGVFTLPASTKRVFCVFFRFFLNSVFAEYQASQPFSRRGKLVLGI